MASIFKSQIGFRLTSEEQERLTLLNKSVKQTYNSVNIKDFFFRLVKIAEDANVNGVEQNVKQPDNSVKQPDNTVNIQELEQKIVKQTGEIEALTLENRNLNEFVTISKQEHDKRAREIEAIVNDPFYVQFSESQRDAISKAMEIIAREFKTEFSSPAAAVHNFVQYSLKQSPLKIQYICS